MGGKCKGSAGKPRETYTHELPSPVPIWAIPGLCPADTFRGGPDSGPMADRGLRWSGPAARSHVRSDEAGG